MRPHVSVLMPVRNGMPWLPEALDSLSRQTLRDFEVIVLEDGSTDRTPEFLASCSDRRVRVIPTGGVGIAAALNLGLAAAVAPLVARQDADDVSAPGRLETQLEYLTSHADVGVLATVSDYIDEQGRPVDNQWVTTIRHQQDVAQAPDQIRELMPLTCCVTHGSVMARASVLRDADGYRQPMAPAEDYDLWLRLLPCAAFAKLPERLYRYRVHATQVSARAADRQLVQTLSAKFMFLRRQFPDLPCPARLIVTGSGRGASLYRALASTFGFTTVALPPSLCEDKLALLREPIVRRWTLEKCEVLVVPSFAHVDAYATALQADAADSEVVRVGNFFVPRARASREAA